MQYGTYGYEYENGYEDGYFRRGQNYFERETSVVRKDGFATLPDALESLAAKIRETEERDATSEHDYWATPLRLFLIDPQGVLVTNYEITTTHPRTSSQQAEG